MHIFRPPDPSPPAVPVSLWCLALALTPAILAICRGVTKQHASGSPWDQQLVLHHPSLVNLRLPCAGRRVLWLSWDFWPFAA
ncbi:hypothetical protein K461DRAFT_274370 [Myriangium duriaei CBS 260.36]|uniref:Uncharacterized protein n=1 Tax=Myriangium duriaei CBS 260.36 TaxID=1168546 RepID=A0A9P4MKD1_9PEZI|nr:hypothetical protein K461DRAFT_274370 [Myriangium duriaei CBS 260.36]